MKVTPDIIRHEFIGAKAKIAESPHSNYIGISGEVINETKNMFILLHKGKAKSVTKNSTVFNFNFSDGTIVKIDGRLLVGRPEDRLKKTIKRLW
jgi:ribonuclease P protein subunit POP4